MTHHPRQTLPKIRGLDGIRALAAVSVVIFHVNGAGYVPSGLANRLFNHLNGGVALFFLLSGFLLYRPFVVARQNGEPVSVRRYLTKRVARIIPAYWLALFVLAIWPGLPGFFGGPWLSSAFFLQIYSFHWYGTGLPVAWSLCTEMSFYLALPLYAWAALRATRRAGERVGFYGELTVLAGVAGGALLLHMEIAKYPRLVGYGLSLPATAYLFCAGMVLALCSVHAARGLSRRLVAVAEKRVACWLGALAWFGLLTFVHLPFAGYRGSFLGPTHPLYLPAAFLLILPVALAPSPRAVLDRLLASRPMVMLGTISYGVYLWHYPLVHEVGSVFGRGAGGIPVILGTLLLSSALAALSFRFLEKPVLDLVDRRRDRRSVPRPLVERVTAESLLGHGSGSAEAAN